MLVKFVLVATLAVEAFGRTTFGFPPNHDPYEEYSQMVATEYCKATHAEDKVPEVKSSIKTVVKGIASLFDTDTLQNDVEKAMATGTYDTFFKKYCPKAPQLKDYIRDLVKGATPCLSAGRASMAVRSSNTLIDFVCDNDSAKVTSFVKEEGPECIQNNMFDFGVCYQTMSRIQNVTNTSGSGSGLASSLAMSEKERCNLTDQGLMCMVKVLQRCSSPTPGKIVQELQDVYLESMSCPKTSQASAVSGDVEELKKKKLELEVRIAELEMWNRENELNVQHTDLTSDIKKN